MPCGVKTRPNLYLHEAIIEDAERNSHSTDRGIGGRGAYSHVDGDFHRLHLGVEMQTNSAESMKDGRKHSLRLLSWNASGMSEDGVQDMLTMLNARGEWDVLLRQEGPKAHEDTLEELEGGHLFLKAPAAGQFRSVGILIHRRWANDGNANIFCAVTGRVVYADMTIDGDKIRVVTAHLPHNGKSDIEFVAALTSLEDTLRHARRKQRVVSIGVDANAVLGRPLEHDDLNITGRWGLGERSYRGETFAAWLRLARLAVANTRFQKPADRLWTHRLWSTSELRQLDFMLIDASFAEWLQDADIEDCLGDKSDHRAVCTRLRLAARQRKRTSRRMFRRGWAPTNNCEGKPAGFHKAVTEGLQGLGTFEANAITSVVVNAATANGKAPKKEDLGLDALVDIRELIDARRMANSADERKESRRSCNDSYEIKGEMHARRNFKAS